ncbi:MAG: DUF927 domain-containing protein [Clostridia bacterium]|nr:DUF927 domain-containing protein [Clostridia bacterium]
MDTYPNLDNIVDYRTEYESTVEKAKITGTNLLGCCPFHGDKNPSFSVDLTTGKYTCFSCGEQGNFVTYWAKLNNVDTKTAYQQILERYGVAMKADTYTVSDYAAAKRLPLDWLVENYGLADGKDKDGTPYIRIPYYAEGGKAQVFRKRYPKGAPSRFKWGYGSAGKLLMYGENRLKYIREVEHRVLIVEGESDTQTLTFLGLPALGVPGASTYHPAWTSKLQEIDAVYLHIEPDQGGEAFLAQMTKKLRDGGYKGTVYKWTVRTFGVKDPSDLYIRDGKDKARQEIDEALNAAKYIDLDNLASEIPVAIVGAPLNLRQPEGFIYSEKGIAAIDEKTLQPVTICRTPIIITKRLRSIDNFVEKVELAFKRDGEWHTTVQPRSIVFQAKAITTLADNGMTLTSENARFVVRFLERLESENIDIIPLVESTSSFGWMDKPDKFLPGFAGDTVLDIEPSLRGWAAAYCKEGDFERWKEIMAPHRQRHIFRFILSAAFTAPLLRILKQRIFFVYNWGGSKGGKSAAIKAALSVWGDPERLMVNFNATQVALERMAGFYCDLPLGIDERQLAGNNQGALEKIVYMLASGTGRIRGSKGGGLQALNTWRTVVLASGEEPITTETSQTGVSTRVLELYGAPFDDEKSASLMHQHAAENFGFAGEQFLRKLIAAGDALIRERYEQYREFVWSRTDGVNGAHAAGIAAVALADELVSEWIFGESVESAKTEAMALAECIISVNAENSVRDVNENAVGFVFDWIESNFNNFTADARVRYGETERAEDGSVHAYVYPSILTKALSDAGYSARKTLKYMAEKGMIGTVEENGRTRFSTTRRINYAVARVIDVIFRKTEPESVTTSEKSVTTFTTVGGIEDSPFVETVEKV